MRVYLLTSDRSKKVSINISELTTASQLRCIASQITSIPNSSLKLIYYGKLIKDDDEIDDNNDDTCNGSVVKKFKIIDGDSLHCMGRGRASSSATIAARTSVASLKDDNDYDDHDNDDSNNNTTSNSDDNNNYDGDSIGVVVADDDDDKEEDLPSNISNKAMSIAIYNENWNEVRMYLRYKNNQRLVEYIAGGSSRRGGDGKTAFQQLCENSSRLQPPIDIIRNVVKLNPQACLREIYINSNDDDHKFCCRMAIRDVNDDIYYEILKICPEIASMTNIDNGSTLLHDALLDYKFDWNGYKKTKKIICLAPHTIHIMNTKEKNPLDVYFQCKSNWPQWYEESSNNDSTTTITTLSEAAPVARRVTHDFNDIYYDSDSDDDSDDDNNNDDFFSMRPLTAGFRDTPRINSDSSTRRYQRIRTSMIDRIKISEYLLQVSLTGNITDGSHEEGRAEEERNGDDDDQLTFWPLHASLKAPECPWEYVLMYLNNINSQQLLNDNGLREKDENNNLPLHLACMAYADKTIIKHEALLDVFNKLINLDKDAVSIKSNNNNNNNNDLPLHICASNMMIISQSPMKDIFNIYPEAISSKNILGFTPLHIAALPKVISRRRHNRDIANYIMRNHHDITNNNNNNNDDDIDTTTAAAAVETSELIEAAIIKERDLEHLTSIFELLKLDPSAVDLESSYTSTRDNIAAL